MYFNACPYKEYVELAERAKMNLLNWQSKPVSNRIISNIFCRLIEVSKNFNDNYDICCQNKLFMVILKKKIYI